MEAAEALAECTSTGQSGDGGRAPRCIRILACCTIGADGVYRKVREELKCLLLIVDGKTDVVSENEPFLPSLLLPRCLHSASLGRYRSLANVKVRQRRHTLFCQDGGGCPHTLMV